MRHVKGPGRISPWVAVGSALMLGMIVFSLPEAHAATAGVISTVAGNGTTGFFGDTGQASAASLNLPSSVAVDAAGNIFFADTVNNRVRRVDAASGVITTVAGGGTPGVLGDGGAATAAALNGPIGIAFDPSGNLFIADVGNNRIRKVTVATGKITTVAGGGTNVGLGDNGPALQANLTNPQGVIVDASGNIYIADTGDALVRKVDSATNIIRSIAGTGTPASSADGGLASLSSLVAPVALVLDTRGNLLISDEGDNKIRKIDAVTGFIGTVAGGGASLADGGPATAALLVSPKGLALDSGGNLFVADDGNNRVRRIDVATGIITTIAGTGNPGFSGDGGLATAATLTNPRGVAIDGAGVLYIADTNNARIRKVVGSATPGSGNTAPPGTVIVGSGAVGMVGGAGPLPIPSFIETVGEGGTPPVTVIFDPRTSYLPVSPDPVHQIYLYQLTWDFGDGSTTVFPAKPVSDPVQALGSVQHIYSLDQVYTVVLRIDVFIFNTVDKTISPGPSGSFTGQAHASTANFPPSPALKVVSSPATGALPYQLVVDPSASFDSDGFIIWAALDWGDGTNQLIDLSVHPLPTIPAIGYTHTYNSPGVYKVTLSVIDNGRGSIFTAYPQPPSNNPDAALTALTAFYTTAFPTLSVLNGPILRQDFATVVVPGSLEVKGGTFKVDFVNANSDSFNVQFAWNTALESVANINVTVQVGTITFPNTAPLPGQPPPAFRTDSHGHFSNQAQGLSFAFNPKSKSVSLKITHAALATTLRVTNSNVVNGNVDVPVIFVVNGTTAIGTTVRFVYNSKQGGTGVGKNARTKPGN